MKTIDLNPGSYTAVQQRRYTEALIIFDVVIVAIVMYAIDFLADSYFIRGILTTLHSVNIAITAYLLRRKGLWVSSILIIAYIAFRVYVNSYNLYYLLAQGSILATLSYLIFHTREKLRTLQQQTESDIAELQIKEAMIRENQKNYLRLFNRVDDALWLVDKDWTVLVANDTVRQVFGIAAHRMQGTKLCSYFRVNSESEFIAEMNMILSEQKRYSRLELNTLEGFSKNFETRISTAIWNGREIYFLIAHDIVEESKQNTSLSFLKQSFARLFTITR